MKTLIIISTVILFTLVILMLKKSKIITNKWYICKDTCETAKDVCLPEYNNCFKDQQVCRDFCKIQKQSSEQSPEQPQIYDVLKDLRNNLIIDRDINLSSPGERKTKNNFVVLQTFDQIGPLGLIYKNWNAMKSDLSELSKYFTCLWLPPCSKSTGNPGYIPVSYTDLNSYWGTENEFIDLVREIRFNSMDAMVDIVFHHALGTDLNNWYKLDFINRNKPEDYLSTWQWQNNFGYNYQRTDLSKSDIIENDNNSSCMKETYDHSWKVSQNCVPYQNNINCSKVKPMYGIDPNVMDNGNLSALNLCDLEILKVHIQYLWKLSKLGINAFRYDQANGIPPAMFQLYNNSSISNTRNILKKVMDHCYKARMYPTCKNVYNNQIEDQINSLTDEQLKDFTAPTHDLAVAECFTYSTEVNYVYDYPNHSWWALVPMLNNMNDGLNQNDKIGVFDFTLNRVLYMTLGNNINSSFQPLCANNKGYQNMVYYPQITLDSDFWYTSFSKGFETKTGDKVTNNIPLVIYKDQKFCSQSPCQVYTFVTNHDNDGIMKTYGQTQDGRGYQDEGFVSYSRMELAYFIILMMPGIPVILNIHFNWFKTLRTFLVLRDTLGITFNSKLEVNPDDKAANRLTWIITTPENKTYTFAIIDTVKYYDDNKIFNLPKIFEQKMFVSWADVIKNPILLQVYRGRGRAL